METIRNNGCQYDISSEQPVSLAMAYVPMQQWSDLYDVDVALQRGTIFAQLDKPFLGREALINDESQR